MSNCPWSLGQVAGIQQAASGMPNVHFNDPVVGLRRQFPRLPVLPAAEPICFIIAIEKAFFGSEL